MKTASQELINLLNSATKFLMADLFTFKLKSGAVLRYTNADMQITYSGNIFSKNVLIQRGNVRFVSGLESDSLIININADSQSLVDGRPFIAACVIGALDASEAILERAFFSSWNLSPVGAINLFSGRVADIECERTAVKLTVKSDIELLDLKLPRNTYQSGCLNTLYDGKCGANKQSFSGNGTALAGSTKLEIQSSRQEAAGWFDQGVIEFTSGANAGTKRNIKNFSNGKFSLSLPLLSAPSIGDAFTAYAGCDKTKATCGAKFSNLQNFRGFPFIPIPETVV